MEKNIKDKDMKLFDTSQEAWEYFNENLFKPRTLVGAIDMHHISVSYDNFFHIEKPRVDPNFDFARMFNYRINKWKSLVRNYLNLEDLQEIKKLTEERSNRNSKIYQHTLKFANNYKNGKDCLISVTFSKRAQQEVPVLIFHTRALEATKRMLLDLLLVQRMGEYVYGKYAFKIIVYCPMIYIDSETFTMYDNHREITDILPVDQKYHIGQTTKFQERVFTSLANFQKTPIDQIKYKVHKRCARQLQFDKKKNPIGSGTIQLLAKNLKLKT